VRALRALFVIRLQLNANAMQHHSQQPARRHVLQVSRPFQLVARGRVGIRGSALIALCALPALVAPPLQRPNLTGTWVLNATKTRLEVPMPDSTIFVIQDSEPIVRNFRTHVTGGRVDTVTIVLRTDSSRVDWALGPTKLTSRSWWDGAELVYWTGFADPQRVGDQVVRYSISADGQTLTAVERIDMPTVKHLNRWVFDRRSKGVP
jgi:hypothetical protein